jgi:hypothetical protein
MPGKVVLILILPVLAVQDPSQFPMGKVRIIVAQVGQRNPFLADDLPGNIREMASGSNSAAEMMAWPKGLMTSLPPQKRNGLSSTAVDVGIGRAVIR